VSQAHPEPSAKLRRLFGRRVWSLDERLQTVLDTMASVLPEDEDSADDEGHVRRAAEAGAAHARSVGLATSEVPPVSALVELLTGYWLWLRSTRAPTDVPR
jgi:hypothetical protein